MLTTAGVTDSEMEMKAWLRSATGCTAAREGVGAPWNRVAAWEPVVHPIPEARRTPPVKAAPVKATSLTLARTGSNMVGLLEGE
jgi:hypothetical protein